MPPDKYTAVWVSHTSMSDFLKCPRAYFLKHVYRDPKNWHKIKLMTPQLALGQAVHEVLESLSILPKEKRFLESLIVKFERAWEKVSGEKGGFASPDMEYRYKTRGQDMLRRVMRHPGPVGESAVKIQQDLPYFWLSEEENIILCGKIDWLEYFVDTDAVHIIDFKTGRYEEDPESLQLSIYHLLVYHCQKRTVCKASYWYIDRDDAPKEQPLGNREEAKARVLRIAQQIKLARQLERFSCPENGCGACRPYEAIARGEGQFVGEDGYHYDVYILPEKAEVQTSEMESVIL